MVAGARTWYVRQANEANAKLADATRKLHAKRQEMLPKAAETGATPDQIKAEWAIWLDEIEKQASWHSVGDLAAGFVQSSSRDDGR